MATTSDDEKKDIPSVFPDGVYCVWENKWYTQGAIRTERSDVYKCANDGKGQGRWDKLVPGTY